MKKSIVALLLMLTLVMSACSMTPEKVDGILRQLEGKPTFEEMEYSRPDMDALQEAGKAVCEAAQTQNNAEAILDSLFSYYDLYEECQTMYNLADIRHSLDLSDPYYKEEYATCSQLWSQVGENLDSVYRSLAQSPMKDELEELYFDEGYFDQYLDEDGQALESVWTEKFLELLNQEAQLEAQYYDVLDSLSQNQGEGDYTKKLAEALAPVYLDMIRVRQAMAQEMGYPDYESFAWDWSYERDYTPQEAQTYVTAIQEKLVPMYQQLWNSDFFENVYETRVSKQQIQDYVKSAAKHMGGVMEESWETLEQQKLFDLSAGPNKYIGSYELYLPSYEVPFVFLYPYGDITDYISFSHEFGHFINDYATKGSYLSVDNAEALSQAMEYLATSYSLDTDADTLESLRKMTLANSLCTYVDQAAYHSFEHLAYKLTEEELTLENLNGIYTQVLQDFGHPVVEGSETDWAEVPHFFVEPFYVLSYVVSNDISMQIYEKELENAGDGLELYEALSMQWEDEDFQSLLKEAEIINPLEPERLSSLQTHFKTELIEELH